MSNAYISLGSNLYNPLNNIETAIKDINKIHYSKLIKISSFYKTLPYGIINQPKYINAAVLLKTYLSPEILLKNLQKIEKIYNKEKKTQKWGPRILDLDILLFDNLIIKSKKLTIPHYDILNRSFFIVPLIEINPKICLPSGKQIIKELKKFNLNDIKLYKI